MRSYSSQFSQFGKDTDAVTAVEFALLAPVMILMLLGSFDIARAIEVKNKIGLLSRTLADFTSQSARISDAELATLAQASRSVLHPYSDASTVLTYKIDSVRPRADDPNVPTIDWSYPPATQTDAVPTYTPPSLSVIRAQVSYRYNLRFSGFLFERLGFDHLMLHSVTYMVPRLGNPVEANW